MLITFGMLSLQIAYYQLVVMSSIHLQNCPYQFSSLLCKTHEIFDALLSAQVHFPMHQGQEGRRI